TGIDEVPICTGYDVDGVIHREMPMTQTEFHHATPVYETLPGWTEVISQARTSEVLPENARAYIRRLEALAVCRNTALAVGPDHRGPDRDRPRLHQAYRGARRLPDQRDRRGPGPCGHHRRP